MVAEIAWTDPKLRRDVAAVEAELGRRFLLVAVQGKRSGGYRAMTMPTQMPAVASGATARLQRAPGPGPLTTWRVFLIDRFDGRRVVVGRAEHSDVCIADPRVSLIHAALAPGTDGVWRISDRGSSNGTFVDDARLGQGEQRELRAGAHALRFAGVVASFVDAAGLAAELAR